MSGRFAFAGTILLPVLLLTGGCASLPADVLAVPTGAPARIELTETPFYPQERYQCGPAALATVLTDSGIPVELQDLVERVYVPGRRGSLQIEMMASTRAAGRLPYRVEGSLNALLAELAAGRPVLVLQNLGVEWIPRWHYAVVVGADLERGEIVLRSGTIERRVSDIDVFLRTWRRSGYWGFVALPPGQLPALADRRRYLQSVADLEDTGHVDSALSGWQAALERWPGDPVALFGYGNAQLASGKPEAAETAYRQLIDQEPQHAMAKNNLAYALARQGKDNQARRVLLEAMRSTEDETVRAVLADSLSDLHP